MTPTSNRSTPFARRVFAFTCAGLLLAVVIGASRAESRELEGAQFQAVSSSRIAG